MSVLGLERSHTSPADLYDHSINLIDSTAPVPNLDENQDDPTGSRSGSGQPLGRQWTKGHLRKELARRKYAKWQDDKKGPNVESVEVSGTDSDAESEGVKHSKAGSSTIGRLKDKVPFRSKKKSANLHDEHDTFIDVLYENQRGSFFCGIPLYSMNGLLNFDPAGWQNSTFQDSAVNITNAQVPDPSWQWDWKTWYVDMTGDVDEEGWQYSFSFGNYFAWHGNHPWFHSFVRRRRWLRKRRKVHQRHGRGRRGGMKEAHMLNTDYFTIHAAGRDQSRDSSADRTTMNRSSFVGAYDTAADDSDDDMGEIADIAALLAAFKRAVIDREKIVAVRTFLQQGGDELYYLASTMPTIMDDFVHQTSKRQLQRTLLQALDEAIKADDDGIDDEDRSNANKRRTHNLLTAIRASGIHFNDGQFWASLRTKAPGIEADSTHETHALDATQAAQPFSQAPKAPRGGDGGGLDVKEEIKGISDDAHVSEEPHIGFGQPADDESQVTAGRQDKGKGKA